jgi:hypothetical protein
MDQSGETSIASSHGTVCTEFGSENEASKPRPCRLKPGVHDTRDPAVQPVQIHKQCLTKEEK